MSVISDNRLRQLRAYGYTGSLHDMLFKYYGDIAMAGTIAVGLLVYVAGKIAAGTPLNVQISNDM